MASRALSLLKELVRFPSLSRQESAICAFVQGYAEAAGLPTCRWGNSVCFWLGEGTPRLLLNSHLDVVPPSRAHPFDPFDPVELGGLLFGRGTADAKASGAAMTAALIELAEEGWSPLQGQVMVALTECEETDFEHNGLRALRKVVPKPDAALVGEPTNLVPMVAQKGLMILRVDAKGKSAHAARAKLGENAILKALRDIQRLEDLTFAREDPWVGYPSVNITTIEGGIARNVIPDSCTFYVDIRSTPAYTHAEITQHVQSILESEVTVHSDRIVPVATSVDADIVQACLRALPGSRPTGSPTASDWIYLSDVPTVKIGPGTSEKSHTSDESIDIAELEQAVDAFKHIVREYFAGSADT